jgi:energy-coupling factor transporter ATP-binding protein EcfA2
MEILYIYLDDFKHFNKQSFNFTPEFIFSTSIKDGTIQIHIKDNPSYIVNFFDNPNILNVTAIIGQNGSGKSNLLDFIKNALPHGSGGFSEQCMVALKRLNPHFDKIDHLIYVTPKLKVEINDTTGKFMRIDIEEEDNVGLLKANYQIDFFSDAEVIFYSNIVDLKMPSTMTRTKLMFEEEGTSTTGFSNISTLSLLSKDQENFSNDPTIVVDKIDAFKARELTRNLEFIASKYRQDLIPFPLPEEVIITLMTEDEKALQKDNQFEWVFAILDKYKNDFKYKSPNDLTAYYQNFLRSIFFNQLRTDLKFSSISFYQSFLETLKGDRFEDFFQNMLIHLSTLKYEGADVTSLRNKSVTLKGFTDFVHEFIIKHAKNISTFEEPLLRLPISFEGNFSIQQFADYYFASKNITDFLNFRFRNLSSGEQSLLTLMSRFYGLTRDFKNDNPKKNLIILFDEPDVYFHPEWQRKVLNQLIKYIPELFPASRIQFILTANTPFLASDLPNSNIILLLHRNDESISKSQGPLASKTFGANIHTLLSDSFFVSHFMGEFAKNKIEKLIRYLQDDNASDLFTPEDAQKLIDHIGEPLIHDRLQDLYNDKFGLPSLNLIEERNRLAAALEQIDNMIKHKSDDKN